MTSSAMVLLSVANATIAPHAHWPKPSIARHSTIRKIPFAKYRTANAPSSPVYFFSAADLTFTLVIVCT